MVYTDYHVHSSLSHDGISSIEEHIEYAINKGIKELCFTEHFDIYEGIENTKLKTIDVHNYAENYYLYKEKYKEKIKLKFGIEIGLQPDIQDKVKELVSSFDFDFIIGSSHITCKKDISKDNSFFDGLTQKESYMKYFNEVLENIKLYDEFDVYGHIDYIVRYGGYDNKYISYSEYKEILDEILISLIKKDKGIEVNTSGYRYGLNMSHPNVEILSRYKELGGKIVTLGSDAHICKDLCSNFSTVTKILKGIGYTHYTIFENRVPKYVKLF